MTSIARVVEEDLLRVEVLGPDGRAIEKPQDVDDSDVASSFILSNLSQIDLTCNPILKKWSYFKTCV